MLKQRRRPVRTGNPPDLKQAIVAALQASEEFQTIAGMQIFPTMLPQTARAPAVAYHVFESDHTMEQGGAAGMREVQVEYEILTYLVSDMEAMCELLRNRFQGLIQLVSGVLIKWVSFDGQADQYFEPLAGSDLGTHYKSLRFTYKLRETLPTHT